MFHLPQQALWLLQQFEYAGYTCYLVGGCVRDFLLGRTVHDYDFTTNAKPQEMLAFLSKQPCTVVKTGISYGTITVVYQGFSMEITTYRIEQDYQNHRSPKHVTFTDNIIADLERRDFTVNAMGYHPKTGIIDPFHGQADLKKRILRCVGNSEQRFQEDALRILRAIRFSFTLNFKLDLDCCTNIIKHASLLTHISQERIQAEFQKMLMNETQNLLQTLRAYHVLEYIVPYIKEIYDITQESKWHIYDVFKHSDIALNNTKDFTLTEKLAVLFHDFGKARCKKTDKQGIAHFPNHQLESCIIAKQALYEMKYPKQMINAICQLIALHDDYIKADERSLRQLLAKLDMNYTQAFSLIRIQYADACAKNPIYAKKQLDTLHQAQLKLKQMKQKGFSIKRSDLQINGHELIKLGYRGKQIKKALDWLYEQIIENPASNQRDELIALLKQYKN